MPFQCSKEFHTFPVQPHPRCATKAVQWDRRIIQIHNCCSHVSPGIFKFDHIESVATIWLCRREASWKLSSSTAHVRVHTPNQASNSTFPGLSTCKALMNQNVTLQISRSFVWVLQFHWAVPLLQASKSTVVCSIVWDTVYPRTVVASISRCLVSLHGVQRCWWPYSDVELFAFNKILIPLQNEPHIVELQTCLKEQNQNLLYYIASR